MTVQLNLFPVRKWTIFYRYVNDDGKVVARSQVTESETLTGAIRDFVPEQSGDSFMIDAIRRI